MPHPDENMKGNCKTCKYWDEHTPDGSPDPNKQEGDCRHGPAQAAHSHVTYSGYQSYTHWPITHDREWCWQWEKSEEE